jgi:ubiquinone/menaquinone biosynthesis C-methylase UbiE
MNTQTTTSSTGYVDSTYLDAANIVTFSIKQRTHDLMRISAGHIVLDLGCGVGIDTLSLAQRVGPSGHVYGVDRDQNMLDEANRRMRQAGVDGYVSHQLGDAVHLPYASNFFDSCRTERMLIHVADSPKVVAELHRVLKPNGWVVLAEPDWGSLSIATQEYVDVERRLARFRAERQAASGYAGRNLYQWMCQEGFQNIEVEIWPILWTDFIQAEYLIGFKHTETLALAEQFITEQELAAWHTELQRMHEQNSFFASLNIVVASGQKNVSR